MERRILLENAELALTLGLLTVIHVQEIPLRLIVETLTLMPGRLTIGYQTHRAEHCRRAGLR